MSDKASDLLDQLAGLNEPQLRRLLVEHLTKQKLGLYWEAGVIEHVGWKSRRLHAGAFRRHDGGRRDKAAFPAYALHSSWFRTRRWAK
ncbi:MAG: hypothetical protein Q8Q28_13450 [Pseudomonadota bacterium]|nr:hypothetical protein [Pseudomonadota bacterium]